MDIFVTIKFWAEKNAPEVKLDVGDRRFLWPFLRPVGSKRAELERDKPFDRLRGRKLREHYS